jgi:hypothetical protein
LAKSPQGSSPRFLHLPVDGRHFGYKQKFLKQGVCHTVALPSTLKSILLRQKKKSGNSNISPCKKYNLQKNPLIETKILQDIIT